MKGKVFKVSAFLIIVAMLGSMFIGCGSSANNETTAAPQGTTSAQSSDSSTAPEPPKPVTLTAFYVNDPDVDQFCGGDPNKRPWQEEETKLTGISFKYITAAAEGAAEKFKLLLNSGDVPDVFSVQMDTDYPGGRTKALEDKVIAAVNPYLDTLCKDFKKALEADPEYMRSIKDDNGTIYGFAALRSNNSRVYGGPMVRKDLLDKAGISKLPVTINDWHEALKAIKGFGYTSPLTIQFHWKLEEGAFVGAYGTTGGFAIGTDDTIHFGAIEEGYKQFLVTFAQWYKEGLIDPEFFTVADGAKFAAKMTDMKTSGAGVANVSRIQHTNSAGKATDPNYDVVGCQYPVLNEGDAVLYGQQDPPVDQRWYVSGKSDKIEDAMRYYNFHYTDAGIALSNWGIKDLTYTEKDGKKAFTDEIPITVEKSPKGWTQDQALKMYVQMAVDTDGVEDGDSFMALRMTYPGQADAIEKWKNFKLPYVVPPSLSYTEGEMKAMNKEANITDTARAWRMKFILGNEPISKWDQYVEEMKKLGVEEVLKAKNDAYTRFKAR